jgi:hypothetical protein
MLVFIGAIFGSYMQGLFQSPKDFLKWSFVLLAIPGLVIAVLEWFAKEPKIDWKERNFINPPYSRKLKESFVIKAIEESKKGKLCVMLLPVSTSTKLFHEWILPNQKDIRFIKGRIKFSGKNTKGEWVSDKAGMHDSMVVVFDGRDNLETYI